VEGPTLHTVLQKLSLEDLLHVMGKLARAVGHAHGHRIVHRDLKPANVLIRESDGQPIVTDFGLARPLDRSSLTKTGTIMGTPQYLAPEQADDSKSVTPASDVYALGTIFYEGLTGRTPFAHIRGAVIKLLKAILTEEPKPPSATNHRVPQQLEAICMKALAKDPAKRYPDGDALAEALEEAQEELFGETSEVDLTPMLEALAAPAGQDGSVPTTRAQQPSTTLAKVRSGVFSSLGVVLLATSFCFGFPWALCVWTGSLQKDRSFADLLERAQVLTPEEAVQVEGLVCVEDAVATVESPLVVKNVPCIYVKTFISDVERKVSIDKRGNEVIDYEENRRPRESEELSVPSFSIGPLRVKPQGIQLRDPTVLVSQTTSVKRLSHVWRSDHPSTIVGTVRDGVLSGYGEGRFGVVQGKTHREWVDENRSEGFVGFVRDTLVAFSLLAFLGALLSFALRRRRGSD
jgi:hypothetical protein